MPLLEKTPRKKKALWRGLRAAAAAAALALALTTAPPAARAAYDLPADKAVTAQAALLVGLGTTQAEDTVLFERDADRKRSPAALVRLTEGLTALQIIRDKGVDIETATGTYTDEAYKAIAGTGIATVMNKGEVWTVKDLLSVAMTHTAGDAAAVLAITLAGSHEAFVAEMNALVRKIGCESTTFANVSGNDSINQYTTARDLYRIVRYGMDDDKFAGLFSQPEYTVHPVSGGEARTFANTNRMIRPSTGSYYSAMAFGKTGVTDPAGECLVSVARDSGYEYLCVVLGSSSEDGNAHYADTRTLFNWAFSSFEYMQLVDTKEPVTQLKVNLAWDTDTVTLVPAKNLSATVIDGLDRNTIQRKLVDVPDSVDAPVTKGQVFGRLELYISLDQKIGEVDLVAADSVRRSDVLLLWRHVKGFLTSKWFFALLGLLVLLILGYAALFVSHNYSRRKRRVKRVRPTPTKRPPDRRR